MTLNKILLVINIFFLQSYLIRFNIGPYPSNLQEVLIALNAIVFLFAVPFKQLRKNLKNHWIIAGLIFLTAISIATTSITNDLDFFRHLKFFFFASVLTYIFLETFQTENHRNAAIRIMGVGAIMFGLFSVIYNLLGFNVVHDKRLTGPLDSAVYLAYYLTPFFLYFLLQKRGGKVYATILGALILATRSMGAIGAAVLVLVFHAFRQKGNTTTKVFASILTVIAAVVIFYAKVLPAIQTNYSSLNEREEIWLVSAEILKDPAALLFGTGLGQFQTLYENNADQILERTPLDYKVLQPHNIFLLFIFQYGILGLALLLFLIYKTIRHPKEAVHYVLLYFFIHGMIDTPIFKNDLLFLFILFAELSYASPLTKSIKTA